MVIGATVPAQLTEQAIRIIAEGPPAWAEWPRRWFVVEGLSGTRCRYLETLTRRYRAWADAGALARHVATYALTHRAAFVGVCA